MESETNEALDRERRKHLLNLGDPAILSFYHKIRERIAPSIKPGENINILAEELVIQALLFAYEDPLSGLSNKSKFRVEVKTAMAVASRLNIPLVVLYMDGEGFKEINDKLGHSVGDEVIKYVGEGLRKSTRETDITMSQVGDETPAPDVDEPNIEVARNGGDEFAAVLLGANLAQAKMIEARIHIAVAESVREGVPKLEQELGRSFELTIGMAQYNPNIHHSAEELIKTADDNLIQIRQQLGQPRRS